MMHHLPDTPPSKGSNPIDLGIASCNPVIIGSRVVICKRNLEELKCHQLVLKITTDKHDGSNRRSYKWQV